MSNTMTDGKCPVCGGTFTGAHYCMGKYHDNAPLTTSAVWPVYPSPGPGVSTNMVIVICPHCGETGHQGECPRVKSIKYYPDGKVKRVKYHKKWRKADPLKSVTTVSNSFPFDLPKNSSWTWEMTDSGSQ